MTWTREEAELHGFVSMTCNRCGWRGMTDSGHPECECHNGNEDGELPGIDREAIHIARKYYLVGTRGEIRPGDRYRKTVTRYYTPGGPWGRWYTGRTRLEKGPAWDEHTVKSDDGWDGHPIGGTC